MTEQEVNPYMMPFCIYHYFSDVDNTVYGRISAPEIRMDNGIARYVCMGKSIIFSGWKLYGTFYAATPSLEYIQPAGMVLLNARRHLRYPYDTYQISVVNDPFFHQDDSIYFIAYNDPTPYTVPLSLYTTMDDYTSTTQSNQYKIVIPMLGDDKPFEGIPAAQHFKWHRFNKFYVIDPTRVPIGTNQLVKFNNYQKEILNINFSCIDHGVCIPIDDNNALMNLPDCVTKCNIQRKTNLQDENIFKLIDFESKPKRKMRKQYIWVVLSIIVVTLIVLVILVYLNSIQ